MAWNDTKITGDHVTAAEWNAMVTYIESLPTESTPHIIPFEIYDAVDGITPRFIFDYAEAGSLPSTSILQGNSNANYDLLIQANSGDNLPYIRLNYDSSIDFAVNYGGRDNRILMQFMDSGSPYVNLEHILTEVAPSVFEIALTVTSEFGVGPTDVDLALYPAGDGHVKFGTYEVMSTETFSGFIEILDASGTLRKLMVCEIVA
ncbi:MAG: hypothetical protein EHM34_00130 [Nitrosopumilales archaeon]|nr:MAG: hypothetical protein EHM34_00130 [Nitrosopumilales archaeon]